MNNMRLPVARLLGILATTTGLALGSGAAGAAPGNGETISAEKRRVIDHWTAARRAAAQPRDLRIDAQGQAWLRRADGALIAYGANPGQQLRATQVPRGKPGGGGGGGGDSTPPTISNMIPSAGTTIGGSADFSAVITDASGIKSVSFVITYPSGSTQSFSPGYAGNDTWSITLSGFSDGNWSWQVVAKDNGAKGGNTATSDSVPFTVDTSGGGGGGGGGGSHIVGNAGWADGGAVQTAAGRLFYEMPTNSRRKRWAGYVCSGTVATETTTGRSIILTAAHCVYDDANKAFARNVLFIPDQDGTTGSGTDSNCGNDPLGCWVASFGVVDVNWTTRTFPDNIPWDYAYYVVNDSNSHQPNPASTVLDVAAGSMSISFSPPGFTFTHALGYSYSEDPKFMYCAEDMTAEGSANWWLPSCGLSGGSSGGLWVQPMNTSTGNGPIISVNSWGYTGSPGMAGPKLSGTSAYCVFTEAKSRLFSVVPTTDGDAGFVKTCP